MSLKLNLLEYNLKKNDLMVIAPNSVREFIRTEEDCNISGLIFTSGFMIKTGIHKKYIEPFDFFAAHGNPHLHLNTEDATIINDVLNTLLQKSLSRDSNPFGLEILQHYYAAFMYELAALHRKYNADVKIKLTRKEDLSMRFLKLLPKHFREERSVQFYADKLFVTPKYLTQAIKEITTKTAGTFIDEMVIMEAKILLGDPAFSVAQVAESLFFSDQFFFSKFFKNQTGIAPAKYRKLV
jgi:AraC family transcriptional activator of pobA